MTLQFHLHFRHVLALVPLAALLAFVPVAVHAQEVPVLVLSDGDGFWEAKDAADALLDGTQTYLGQAVADGLTINVYSKDAAGVGFREGTDRLARLLEALAYVADVVNEPGELDLMLGASQFDGTGALATGGPLFAALPVQNGTAFSRLQTGVKPFANYAEMVLTFDWGWNWNAGLGNPAADQVDLRSVAVHEITHTLGFLSLIQSSGASSIGGGYSVFDTMVAKGDGTLVLSGSPPAFTALPADLRSDSLIFKGATARVTYGGVYPPLYSPGTFASGSSIQHWAEGITGGAVMEPRYLTGVVKRAFAPVDIAVLRDLGYTNADTAGSYQPCPLSAVVIMSPAGDIDAVADTVAVPLRSSVAFNTGVDCIAATANTVTVEYFINNVSRGTSQDAAGGFPVNIVLAPGDYTLRAEAERNDLAGMVQAERTFTVNEAPPIPQPVLAVNPATGPVDFGTLDFGASQDRVFVVTNAGTGTLNGVASLAGDAEFAFVGAGSYALAESASKNVTVRFTPPKKGGAFSATLTFTGDGGPVQIALTGTGTRTGFLNCAGGGNGVSWQRSAMSDALLLAALMGLLAWQSRRNAALHRRG